MRARDVVGLLLSTLSLGACGDDDAVPGDGDGEVVDSGTEAGFDGGRDRDAGHDAGHDAAWEGMFQCGTDADADVGTPDGWVASKMTRDVWWQGQPDRDPGRGEIDVYTLGRIDGTHATIKVCGITFPPITFEQSCEVAQVTIPDEAWDRPSMPRFTTRSIADAGVGDVTFNSPIALLGIDLLNGEENSLWPSSTMTSVIACEAGTGRSCFPDHDDDSFDGITGRYRTDGAMYVGPYDNGLCARGVPYTYAGAVVQTLCIACGGADQEVRADQVRLGLRTQVGGSESHDDCTASVDLRAYDCTVDPATLDPGDTRIASLDYRCTDAEAQRLDNNLPAYQLLSAGESPGNSWPPLGWVQIDRDIDKRPSTGPRSAFVRLASLSDTEPTCADVRAASYE